MIEHIKNQPPNKLASHNSFAYRIDEDDANNPFESCRDDEEKSAGVRMLRILQSHNVKNTVMVVTRWYGGTHVFNKRWEIMKQCVMSVLGKMGLVSETIPASDNHEHLNKANISNKPAENKHAETVDHLILHDSTGNNIDPVMFSGKDQSTKKDICSIL